MRISKNKKNPYENLTRSQIKNKKLVDILNHKIFKGFRQIKNSKHFFIEKPNFVKAFIWDENKLEPFDDNYNLQYKKIIIIKLLIIILLKIILISEIKKIIFF